MAAPDISRYDWVLPGYRGLETVTVGSDDIVFPTPRFVRALDAGDLTYVDALGTEHTQTLAVGGDLVGPGSALVYVAEVKGSSTLTSIQVGIT